MFLTGINTYIAFIDGNTNRVKSLDHNSQDYAYSSNSMSTVERNQMVMFFLD